MTIKGYPASTRRRALAMLLRGREYAEITDALGCSRRALQYWAREAGIPKRPSKSLSDDEKATLLRLLREGELEESGLAEAQLQRLREHRQRVAVRKLRYFRAPHPGIRRPRRREPRALRGIEMTLGEIGLAFRVTYARISQIQDRALRVLRGVRGLPLQRWVEEAQP